MGEEAGNAAFAERCPEVSLQFEGSLSKEDIFTLVLTLSSEIDLFGSNSFNLPVYRELISREFYAPIESPALRSFAENCYPGVRDVLFVDDQLVDVPVWCLQACQVGVEKSMWRELGLSEENLPRSYLELIDFIKNQWPALADAHPNWCAMRSDDYWLLFHELLSDYSIYRRCADEDPGYDTKIFRNALTAYLSVPAELSEDDANETPIFSAQEEINIMRRILEDLYHGNLTASGQTFRRGTKYARALARLAETEDALGRKLTSEDHPLLAEYAMASAGLTSISLEEAYIEGFRTGARIMLAVLQEDKPQESKDEDKA